jgi:hypothetical protein
LAPQEIVRSARFLGDRKVIAAMKDRAIIATDALGSVALTSDSGRSVTYVVQNGHLDETQ